MWVLYIPDHFTKVDHWIAFDICALCYGLLHNSQTFWDKLGTVDYMCPVRPVVHQRMNSNGLLLPHDLFSWNKQSTIRHLIIVTQAPLLFTYRMQSFTTLHTLCMKGPWCCAGLVFLSSWLLHWSLDSSTAADQLLILLLTRWAGPPPSPSPGLTPFPSGSMHSPTPSSVTLQHQLVVHHQEEKNGFVIFHSHKILDKKIQCYQRGPVERCETQLTCLMCCFDHPYLCPLLGTCLICGRAVYTECRRIIPQYTVSLSLCLVTHWFSPPHHLHLWLHLPSSSYPEKD